MKKQNLFKAIYMSFYSRKLYRDVVKNWNGRVLAYLLLVLALSWAVILFNIQPAVNHATTYLVHTVVPQLPPTFTIKDGEITTPEHHPYVVKSTDKKMTLAVLDTTGKYDTLKAAHTRILVTKDQLIILDNSDVTKIWKIPRKLTVHVDSEQIGNAIIKMMRWLWVILFPVFLLGSYVYRIVQCLVYAMLGKIFGCFMHSTLHYLDLVKLAMVAITPAIVFATVIDMAGIWFRFEWVFYFAVSMGYLIFAIRANKEKR